MKPSSFPSSSDPVSALPSPPPAHPSRPPSLPSQSSFPSSPFLSSPPQTSPPLFPLLRLLSLQLANLLHAPHLHHLTLDLALLLRIDQRHDRHHALAIIHVDLVLVFAAAAWGGGCGGGRDGVEDREVQLRVRVDAAFFVLRRGGDTGVACGIVSARFGFKLFGWGAAGYFIGGG